MVTGGPSLLFASLLLAQAVALPPGFPARKVPQAEQPVKVVEEERDQTRQTGVEVVLKSGLTRLRIDQYTAIPGDVHRRYRVERAEGDQLWIVSGSQAGWVRADEVVPAEGAAEHFSQHLRDDPKAAWAYNRRAVLAYDQKDYDKAIADFTEAIKLDPTRASLHNNRAAAWLAKQEPAKAVADYTEAIRLDPNNATAYFGRGVIRSHEGRLDEAIADYTEALRLRPKLHGAANNRGLALLDKGDIDAALADFHEAIRLDPDSASAYNNRGNAWEAKGDPDRAIADYTEAIQLDPRYVKAYNNRAWLWETKGDHVRALADYDQAIKLDPNDARGYRGRAWIWSTCPDARLRDGKTAVAAATRACELTHWRDPASLSVLAAAEAETGHFSAAVARQTEALKLLPEPHPERAAYQARLELYRAGKPYRQRATQPGR